MYVHTYVNCKTHLGRESGAAQKQTEKSLGGLPGRKSACGELPDKRMAGLFYPHSASLGLSGPQPASQSQPASQLPGRMYVILLVGRLPGRKSACT